MVFGLFRWVIDWDHPGPAVPDGGAYAIRPYPDGRLFSSEWVGAYCIRPIGRPRKGDGGGFWVVSQGALLGVSGAYRARLWGVCNTPLHLRFLFFIHQGRGVWHTPLSDVPGKGTEGVFGLYRWVIDWDHPGLAVPVCGTYAIRPYASGRLYGIISPTAPTPPVLVFCPSG